VPGQREEDGAVDLRAGASEEEEEEEGEQQQQRRQQQKPVQPKEKAETGKQMARRPRAASSKVGDWG